MKKTIKAMTISVHNDSPRTTLRDGNEEHVFLTKYTMLQERYKGLSKH